MAKGDVGALRTPFQRGEAALFFESFNRNKRSICLDLRAPEGRHACGGWCATLMRSTAT